MKIISVHVLAVTELGGIVSVICKVQEGFLAHVSFIRQKQEMKEYLEKYLSYNEYGKIISVNLMGVPKDDNQIIKMFGNKSV
jgi:hypothetical protein